LDQSPLLKEQKKYYFRKDIEKLKEYGITEVYIDDEHGLDVVPDSTSQVEEMAARIGENVLSQKHPVPISFKKEVPYDQEIKAAQIEVREAQHVIKNVMHDVRLGKSIESKKVKQVVNGMIDSILRNPDALTSLAKIKRHDEYTFVHSVNVCVFALTMGRHLNFSREELQQVGIGALLHDTGKMNVPVEILRKPGSLTETEWSEMKKHPLYSKAILEKTEGIPEKSKEVAIEHHERYNGKGYPYGLKGEEISV